MGLCVYMCVCKDVMCVVCTFIIAGGYGICVCACGSVCVAVVYNRQCEFGCDSQRGSVYWAQMNR